MRARVRHESGPAGTSRVSVLMRQFLEIVDVLTGMLVAAGIVLSIRLIVL